MSTRKYVALVGLVAALVGVVLLFLPVSTARNVSCGSLAAPLKLGPALHDAYLGGSGSATSCDDALSSRRAGTLALLIGGAVVGVGALVTRPRRPAST